jgi:hypothetical protein
VYIIEDIENLYRIKSRDPVFERIVEFCGSSVEFCGSSVEFCGWLVEFCGYSVEFCGWLGNRAADQ